MIPDGESNGGLNTTRTGIDMLKLIKFAKQNRLDLIIAGVVIVGYVLIWCLTKCI